MNDRSMDTEFDDYDFLDDESYDQELYDEYDDLDDEDVEFWEEYEADLIEDSAELAEVLREVVHEKYRNAPAEDMEEALYNILDQMSPAEGFNFTSALRQVGNAGQAVLKNPVVGDIARTTLPAAGAAVGTIYGGPVGTSVGAKLGQAAGQAFTGGKKPAASTPPTKIASATPPAAATVPASPKDGSNAAAQLLMLTQNPVLLKTLMSLSLGSHGKDSIPLGPGGQTVQPGPLMGLLSQLAGKAAEDADQLLWESEETPAYLLDQDGEYIVDPAVPEDHAEALYEALLDAENQVLTGEDRKSPSWSNYVPFEKGTKLLVEYETFIRNFDVGEGSVLERTADLFKAKIHIDPWDRFNVPETYAMLMIEYKQEGPSNKAMVVVNGKTYTDNNVTIRSGKNSRAILMSIRILGQNIDQITIKRESGNKAKLEFKAAGNEHVLILTRE